MQIYFQMNLIFSSSVIDFLRLISWRQKYCSQLKITYSSTQELTANQLLHYGLRIRLSIYDEYYVREFMAFDLVFHQMF